MVIVMLYTLRWCAITLCNMENITTVGSGSDCVYYYFYGDIELSSVLGI